MDSQNSFDPNKEKKDEQSINLLDEEEVAANHDDDILQENDDEDQAKNSSENDKNVLTNTPKIAREKVALNHDANIIGKDSDADDTAKPINVKDMKGEKLTKNEPTEKNNNFHMLHNIHIKNTGTTSSTARNILESHAVTQESKSLTKIQFDRSDMSSIKGNPGENKIGYFYPVEKYIWS